MSSPYIPEGWVMGTLGYVMTFAILALLSVIMYVTSKIIEHFKRGGEAATAAVQPAAAPAAAPQPTPAATPTAPQPQITSEELAAATAAVHAHLSRAGAAAPAAGEVREGIPAPGISAWVLRARLDTCSYYGTLVYERIRKRRGWKGEL